MKSSNISRRQLLRRMAAVGASAASAPWLLNLAALAPAHASGTGGYKALVCLYLYGGNDAYNTVLATDEPSWSAYNAVRGGDADPVALTPVGTAAGSGPGFNAQMGGVLPIAPRNSQGRSFALHPQLGAVRDLFAAGRIAVVPNVGPLVKPTTKEDITSNRAILPPKLYSHNDQQSVWQSMAAEGAQQGWGGAMADRLMAANGNAVFTSVSTGSNAVWLSGNTTRPYTLASDGAVRIGSIDGTLFSSAVAQQALVSIVGRTREAHYIEQDHAATSARSIAAEAILTPALPAANAGPWGTSGLNAGAVDPILMYRSADTGLNTLNPITAQMQLVARMIAAHSALGMSGQIFFIGVQGCDTHSGQNVRHADVMAQLAQALSYWDTVTRSMGVDEAVTLFTASDFGRAFSSNGNGTDHGWGGHHFVMGGGVNGGDFYGRFPSYGVTDGAEGFVSDDQLDHGALLPAISVEQYAATLGKWMGLANADLQTIFPNIANWPQNFWDLGFMKT